MLRRVYRLWQTWVTAFACVMAVGYATVAQDDAGSTPKPDAEQETAAPAEPQDDAPAPENDPAPPEAKPDASPAAEEAAKKDAGGEAEDADQPKQAKPVPADEAAEGTTDSAAAFAAKLAEWKELLKQLRALRSEFATAEPEQLPEIGAKWNELLAKGEAMIGDLRETGKLAFLAAPNEDKELAMFLSKIVVDDAHRDNFEPAAELSQALLENGFDQDKIYEPAGVAAFATNDFDKAEEYLTKAKDSGMFGEKGQMLIGELDDYKTFWAKEQELRKAEAEQNDLPRVRLTTSKGDMLLELFENEAPETVANFISLVEKGYYDGLVFHRVLEGFMAQGGCPEGTGTGGPGYTIYCECKKENYRKHFRGTLSMAHAGPDTGGSQFFLTFVPTGQLNGKHTAFGRIVAGMDVLAKIQRIDPEAEGSKPEPDKIIKAEVVRKRDHEYKPNKTP